VHRSTSAILLSVLLATAASSSFAADLAATPAPLPVPEGWLVEIGAGPEVSPSFPGAKTYRVLPTGNVAWHRAGTPEPFASPDDGFGIGLLDLGWLQAGPVARFVAQRGLSNGNGNFVGLHNVGWTGEIGGFAQVWLWPEHLRIRSEVRQAVNGHKGLDGNLQIDLVQAFGPALFSIGPRMAFGNSTYMNAYFSVSPAEAAVNGLVTPYTASGGITSVGAFASVKYHFTPAWSATLFGGYDRLVNSAGASPIPNRLGSVNQFTAGLTLNYAFSLASLGLGF